MNRSGVKTSPTFLTAYKILPTLKLYNTVLNPPVHEQASTEPEDDATA